MMARVDPSLQVVKFRQVIALHSSILGDIVDSEPRVGSRGMISFADKAFNMFPACVDHSREMVSEHVFGCILTILSQGVIQSLRDIGLAYDIHSRIAPRQIRGRGKI